MPGQVEGRQLEDKGHSVERLTPIAAAQTVNDSDMCSEQACNGCSPLGVCRCRRKKDRARLVAIPGSAGLVKEQAKQATFGPPGRLDGSSTPNQQNSPFR